jgi:hypothetical protein
VIRWLPLLARPPPAAKQIYLTTGCCWLVLETGKLVQRYEKSIRRQFDS